MSEPTPNIKIKRIGERPEGPAGTGSWIVLLQAGGGYHAYLHADGVWRQSCIGPHVASGYHRSQEAAQAALATWCESIPLYTQGKKGRYVRVRKPSAAARGGEAHV